MKSAAEALLEMFGVPSNIRPAKVETIIMSLLYTLNKGKLLGQAVSDIEHYMQLPVEVPSNFNFIQSVTGSPEIVGLYNKRKAMQFLLNILPTISVIDDYGVVKVEDDVMLSIVNRSDKSNRYRETKKILQQINALGLGYSIIQPPGTPNNEFHIIKSDDREKIIKILSEHGIQNPSVLDTILKELK